MASSSSETKQSPLPGPTIVKDKKVGLYASDVVDWSNPNELGVAAIFEEKSSTWSVFMFGKEPNRSSVKQFQVCNAPTGRMAEKPVYVITLADDQFPPSGTPPTEWVSLQLKFDAVYPKRTPWVRPLDAFEKPVPCKWLHYVGDFSFDISNSLDGWVLTHEISEREPVWLGGGGIKPSWFMGDPKNKQQP